MSRAGCAARGTNAEALLGRLLDDKTSRKERAGDDCNPGAMSTFSLVDSIP